MFMDANSVTRALSFNEHAQAGGELEVESNTGDSIEVMPSCGDLTQEMERTGEILTRVELDLARSSEKSLNLENLAMHVATRESDLETFVSETEHTVGDSAQGALEFDLLSGILESELTEVEHYLLNLQSNIERAYEMISSSTCCGEAVKEILDKLSDSENSLMQTLGQISELRVQSNNFNRMVLISAGGKDGKATKDMENGYFPDANSKIKMQTAEQRKHVLTMLGKSLERELDLEKKLAEAKQSEELLKLRHQQVLCMEEEAEVTWGKLFEAENAFEILQGVSKELMSKLRMVRFNYSGSVQREEELKSRCEDLNEQLKVKNSNARETQSLIDQLREKVAKAEQRAESAEAECARLRENNTELNKDLNVVKSSEKIASEKASLLEKKLRDSYSELQDAVTSAEASQEKQTMLQAMALDMEILINDLKAKVIKSERQTESAEEKCSILFESNSNFTEELNFLRCRMEMLEASLHLTEETKKETVIDISVRTKLITDLIVQLSRERERLHKQISSLTREKKILSKRLLQLMTKDHSASFKKSSKGTKSVHDVSNASSVGEVKGEATDLTHTGNKGGTAENVIVTNAAETVLTESIAGAGTLRNIDARQLNRKYILVAVGVLLLTAVAASLFSTTE